MLLLSLSLLFLPATCAARNPCEVSVSTPPNPRPYNTHYSPHIHLPPAPLTILSSPSLCLFADFASIPLTTCLQAVLTLQVNIVAETNLTRMGEVAVKANDNFVNGNGVHEMSGSNGTVASAPQLGEGRRRCCWYEEEVDDDIRLCFALNSILHTGVSHYQEIALLDTKPFGKVLIIDGKLQSAEMDEFIYHESLVHPALVHHSNPKTVFIMGGGEGSTAREILRHRSVNKVVMCDIDEEVVDFCKKHLVVNQEAFASPRLDLIINDARAELENRGECFDVIIGDLADPIEGGPCYQLYTKSFYELVVKPKLSHGGIFVTQAGPAGALSHTEVFSCIYNTLRHVFKFVVPYSAHIPSFADTWGWVMASDQPFTPNSKEIDSRTKQRIEGDLRYFDGETFVAASTLNKSVRKTLANETHVYTAETARYIYGHGTGHKPRI